jgi:putative ABC transport system permease protein
MTRRKPTRRLRTLFWKIPVEQEVDEEIAHHLEMQTRRYIDAGMEPAAARAEALRRFGDPEKARDECRVIGHRMEVEMRRAELRHELRQDAGFALRLLRHNPLFTTIALITLAVGIGANTAIFSVVKAVLLQPLPYRHAERVVVIWNRYEKTDLKRAAIAPAEFADILEQKRAFDGVAALTDQPASLIGLGEPEQLMAYAVSPNLFELLGAAPQLGRGFMAQDGKEGAEKVVLLSHELWLRRFGGDTTAVGRAVHVGGQLRTVIGVMPAGVRFPEAPVGFLRERADLWFPYGWEQARSESRGNQYLGMVARIRPGAGIEQARADLDAIAARFRAQFTDRYLDAEGWRLFASPLRDEMVGDVRPALLILLGAVALVLLIACVNVANLLLTRAALRQRELAMRGALGAGRGRLVRQLLTESTLLSLAGGGLGVLLAWWGIRTLVQLDPGSIPRLDGVRIDGAVLAFSLGISAVTGLVFGLAPALHQSRLDLRAALQNGGRENTAGRGHRRFRNALVIAEVAMAFIVLVHAGLLARSFAALQRVETGLDADGVLSLGLSLPRAKYDTPEKLNAFHRELQSRMAAVPGIQQASAVYPLPMSGKAWSASFEIEGRPTAPGEPEPHAEFAVAMPGYFRTLRIPLREGREFTQHDAVGAPEVVIVDELLARRWWPGESAVGKRLDVGEVVGVVAHVRNAGPQNEGEPQIYKPFLQWPQRPLFIVARTTVEPTTLAPALRRAVRAIDPDQPIADLQTMERRVHGAVARERFNMLLLSLFAGVALVLAIVGLYGMMAGLVSQRVHEIGIRLALGGRPSDALRLILGEGMMILLIGLLIGLAGAAALSRAVSGLLFSTGATDPLTYGAIAALVAFVSLAATWVPARRATRVDPLAALREP